MKTLSFSEKGHRQTNEDRILYHSYNENSFLIGVFDGMGGYKNGDLAAEIVMSSISEYISNNLQDFNEETGFAAFEKAHNKLKAELDQAGATAAILFIKDKKAYVFWSGDVKVFLRTNDTVFVSKDHTLLNILKETELTLKPDEIIRLKNTVVKSLGGKSNSFIPDFISFNLDEGFYGFICSDGVHQLFSEKEILEIISISNKTESLKCIFDRCYELATDNFSGILFF